MVALTNLAIHVLTILQDATIGLITLTFNPPLPVDHKHVNSIVRIAVALNDIVAGPTQADGQAPSLVAFNEDKRYIGASNWNAKDHVKSGSFVDVVVHQVTTIKGQTEWYDEMRTDWTAQKWAYLQVLGRDDAVCVAYIGQTWPNGEQRGWLGDMGRACGKRWFYSNVEVGEEKYKPG